LENKFEDGDDDEDDLKALSYLVNI